MSDKVLITGATGYVGFRLAHRYLSEGRSVILMARASDDGELAARSEALRARLPDANGRLEIVRGDLTDDAPMSGVRAADVGEIIHSAAVTAFNVEKELAEAVNLAGSTRLFQFARTCPNLSRFGMLSTVYAAGLIEGEVRESALDTERPFANHYEWSKFESERVLREQFDDLPWNIYRLATVIADDDTGTVTQQNAVHNTLKLFFYGLLSLLPGDSETPLYLVTGQFCADAVYELAGSDATHEYFHVCHSRDESVTLDKFTDIAFSRFEREDDYKARKILRPQICDAESFELLAEGIDSFGGAVVNQGLRSVRPFVRQLYCPKIFSNDKLVAQLAAYRAPAPDALIEGAVDNLVATRWGKRKAGAA
jgi:nucleoside-diphosphate-sugar epimerase